MAWRPAYDSEEAARQEVAHVSRLLWERGYVAATDGNVSVRLGPDRLLVTPSGLSKGFLTSAQLVLTDLDGAPVAGQPVGHARPSSELRMHCAAYRARPDIRAVVHAHPPLATACTVAGVSLEEGVLPEVLVNLGGIPTTPYARPSSAEGALVIREAVREHDALLLPHHGSLTVGRTALEAYLKLEKVENAALVYLAARQLGQVRTLPAEEVQQLLAIHRRERIETASHEGGP
jgi:L-fuculose-phosphate aldolase